MTFTGDFNRQNRRVLRHGVRARRHDAAPANRQYSALAALQDTNPRWPASSPTRPPSTNPFDRLTDIDAELTPATNWAARPLRAEWDLGAGTLTSVTAWRYWDWMPAERPRLHRACR